MAPFVVRGAVITIEVATSSTSEQIISSAGQCKNSADPACIPNIPLNSIFTGGRRTQHVNPNMYPRDAAHRRCPRHAPGVAAFNSAPSDSVTACKLDGRAAPPKFVHRPTASDMSAIFKSSLDYPKKTFGVIAQPRVDQIPSTAA